MTDHSLKYGLESQSSAHIAGTILTSCNDQTCKGTTM
jgi:hypothetical protein